mgnify:CR=1 FL=1
MTLGLSVPQECLATRLHLFYSFMHRQDLLRRNFFEQLSCRVVLSFALLLRFGRRLSRGVFNSRPIKSLEGVSPVVVCGVVRYLNKTLISLVSKPPSECLSPSFTMLTAFSARPFDAGWYGATVMCLTSFCSIKASNSLLVKYVLLSDTTVSGRSHFENEILIFSIVADEVAVLVI